MAAACRNVASVYCDRCCDYVRAVEACQRFLDSTLASSLGRSSPHLPDAAEKLAGMLLRLGTEELRRGAATAAEGALGRGIEVCTDYGVAATIKKELLAKRKQAQQKVRSKTQRRKVLFATGLAALATATCCSRLM